MPGPYDYWNRGINPNQMRSESTENEIARRDIASTPPVTILGDLIGHFSPSTGQENELVQAIRLRALLKMMETGSPAKDYRGTIQNYGLPPK